jgi:hypothetical protein
MVGARQPRSIEPPSQRERDDRQGGEQIAESEFGHGHEGSKQVTLMRYVERNPLRANFVERALWDSCGASDRGTDIGQNLRLPEDLALHNFMHHGP